MCDVVANLLSLPVGELVEVGVATLQTALERTATDVYIHLKFKEIEF